MTSFSMMLQMCGLSIEAAAAYLNTHRRVVLRWVRDGGEPSDEALVLIGALQARQQDVADTIIMSWEDAGRPSELTIAIARSDEEARAMGWPSLDAQKAPAAIAQAVLAPIRVRLEQTEPLDLATAAIAAE